MSRPLLKTYQEKFRTELLREAAKRKQDLVRFDWKLHARPNQRAPEGDWRVWLILAGRGFGKTRTGAEWVREVVKTNRYVNLIGATADDARDIMIEGESGILACCPNAERPFFRKSERNHSAPDATHKDARGGLINRGDQRHDL